MVKKYKNCICLLHDFSRNTSSNTLLWPLVMGITTGTLPVSYKPFMIYLYGNGKNMGKGKGKVFTVPVMKVCRGNTSIAPLIHKFGTR